jgi:hypothetical protein
VFKIESNLNEVLSVVTKKLDALKGDQIIREAAFDTVAILSRRIQQDGKKTDGTPISSNAKKTQGAYSYSHAKKREKKGEQIEYIDLTFEGDMMGDLLPSGENETSWVVGFRGKFSSDKADWNERRFGTIFHLSGPELEIVKKGISRKVNEQLSK